MPTYEEKKYVFLLLTFIAMLTNMYILSTNIRPYEKILTFVVLILSFFLLGAIYNDDKRIINEAHEIYFYWLLAGVVVFQSKSIHKILYVLYMITLLTRFRYNKCLFRIFDNSNPHDDSIKALTFNDKNAIMLILSNILLYRIFK